MYYDFNERKEVFYNLFFKVYNIGLVLFFK